MTKVVKLLIIIVIYYQKIANRSETTAKWIDDEKAIQHKTTNTHYFSNSGYK